MGNSCIKNKKVHISVQTEELVEEENFIINWESDYKTQKYHWWPMREKNKDDPINNLKKSVLNVFLLNSVNFIDNFLKSTFPALTLIFLNLSTK